MKIAILGAGQVGAALGRSWAGLRHEILYGVRNPLDPKHAGLVERNTQVVTPREAAEAAEVVVLATPFEATHAIIEQAGGLAGKIVIDCTNPLKPDLSGLSVGLTTSAGEQVASWAPRAHVFKAFNTTGADNMNPAAVARFPLKPVMFICGNSGQHKPTVLELVGEMGFDARDAGDITAARLLEPFAMLWIHLTVKQGYGREWAFAVMRR